MKTVFLFALQASIFLMVFGFGVSAEPGAVRKLAGERLLLGRSLLSMYVVMPLFAVAMLAVAPLRPPVEAALLALALSPVPPLLPKRELLGGGTSSYAFGLLFTASVVGLVVVPLGLIGFSALLGEPLAVGFGPLVPLLTTIVVPFAAGVALQRLRPALARRLGRPMETIALAVLVVAIIPVMIRVAPEMASLIGDGTVLAFAAFVVVGLVAGHLLGGPDPGNRTVLALSTAARHPAVAMAIAALAFADVGRVPAALILYLLVNVVVTLPYVLFQRRRAAAAARPTPQNARAG